MAILESIVSHPVASDTELQIADGIKTFMGVFAVGMIRGLPKEQKMTYQIATSVNPRQTVEETFRAFLGQSQGAEIYCVKSAGSQIVLYTALLGTFSI